jgi:hypothetical protein
MSLIEKLDMYAAIRALIERDAAGKVLYLDRVRAEPGLALNNEYQKRFNHYYRVQRKPESFYNAFYSILYERALAKSIPEIGEVLREIFRATGERHLSFSSKLVATLKPNSAIYDRNVATLLSVSTKLKQGDDWEADAVARFQQLDARLREMIESRDWERIELHFDHEIPQAKVLSQVRKADLVLWAGYSFQMTGTPLILTK